jgi:hypothetical protein
MSVGFYPSLNYKVLVEFGGPRITPICLTEQQVKTLWGNLPNLSDALCRNEAFTRREELFHLQRTATVWVAKMYLGKSFINFRFQELRNLMDISPFIADHQTKYILAQNDVIQYTVAALGSTQFVDPPPIATNHILFDQLFDELKTVLV